MTLSITDQMRCLQWLWDHRTESWESVSAVRSALAGELALDHESVALWNQHMQGKPSARNSWGPEELFEWRFFDFWTDWTMPPNGFMQRCYRGAIVDAEAVRDEMVRLDALLEEKPVWARTWR